jgi:hypothetical protein
MRTRVVGLLGLGGGLVLLLLSLILWLERPAPAPPNPLTPVIVGDPPPVLPAQPISQTIGGYTATLVPIYADANRIAFTYMLAGPQRAYPYGVALGNYGDPVPRLSGSGGTAFPWLQEASDFGQPGDFDYATGQLHLRPARLVFDGASGSPTVTLSLHLDLPLRISDAPYFPPAPTAVTPILITPTPRPAPETFILPFAFDLHLPFDPRRREATPNQTVITNGIAITLERVTVTASEARLVLRYATVGADTGLWEAGLADGNLTPGSGTLPFGAGALGSGFSSAEPCDPDGRCTASYSAASLLNRPASWTLQLDHLLSSAAPAPPPIPGPWVFSFTLPPLAKATVLP